MPQIIPAQDGLPEIYIFETIEELRIELGHTKTYGLYDHRQNRIYATMASLSHEVAHYRDFHSGQMPRPEILKDPAARRRAKIRNEAVAILFSWIKTREISRLPEHERRFLEWVYFMIDSGRVTPEEPLESMKFSKLQSFADQLVNSAAEQEAVLCEFFSHYLEEDERIENSSTNRIRA